MKLLAFANLTGYVEKVDPSHSTLMMGGLTLHFTESLADVYDGDVIVAEAQCDDMGTWHASIKSMLSNVFIAAAANAAEDASGAPPGTPIPSLAPAPAPVAQSSPLLPPAAHTPVAAAALSSRSAQFNRGGTTVSTQAPATAPSTNRATAPAIAPKATTGSSRAARFGKGIVAAPSSVRPAPAPATQRPAFNTATPMNDLDDDIPF